VDFKDFKSSCRALITSEVGSIPTRSRHCRPRAWSWAGTLTIVILVAAPAGAEPATYRSKASPASTLLRSIAFPGWGQLENDRPFKAAVVFAAEVSLLAGGYVEFRRADRSREAEIRAAERGDAAEAAEEFQRYVDRRDRAINRLWWSTFTVMMSMIDAYTDAHLRDFVPAPPVPDLSAPELDLDLDLAAQRVGLAVRF